MVGSRSTATRVTWGATSLSSSSHFRLVPYSSNTENPVALPPGRARLSGTCANTIGTVRVTELVALAPRSEEHTSELQSHSDLVCRLLLEKKKKKKQTTKKPRTQ